MSAVRHLGVPWSPKTLDGFCIARDAALTLVCDTELADDAVTLHRPDQGACRGATGGARPSSICVGCAPPESAMVPRVAHQKSETKVSPSQLLDIFTGHVQTNK